jgi:NAD(P)-dependent dehydrogenase (short-subunit alcohol dehydrogenase family)
MNVLITGTSSGIGYGLALECLKRGNNVWGISRRITDELGKYENYKNLQLDLTDYSKVNSQVPGFVSDAPSFDLVILNAGILGDIKWMSEIGIEAMKQVMNINVWANKALLDCLFSLDVGVKQVVGISSKASLRSTPGWGPYSMSKAGLNMLMNIYAKEYPDTHFTSFAPGLVDSEIQEKIYSIKETEKYPSTKNLQEARYTDLMPDGVKAAEKLLWGIEKSLQYESGSFTDVRDM